MCVAPPPLSLPRPPLAVTPPPVVCYGGVSRFPAGQQLLTKLVTAPMACGAVMVPTSMFMGQVVTAYNPFGGQQVRRSLGEGGAWGRAEPRGGRSLGEGG